MKLELPDLNKLTSLMLKEEATFVFGGIDPSLGYSGKKKQSIEKWRKNYLEEIFQNRKAKPIQKFNMFAMNLLMRAFSGEKGVKIYQKMDKSFKNFDDVTKNRIEVLLGKTGYRWGAKKGSQVVISAKQLLFERYQGNWERYFNEAEKKYKENFLDDPFLKIPNVSFKVRDLALSCFSKFYSANDVHVVRTITRSGLLVYGYGDINLGNNPGDIKHYLFLHRLIIKLSKESGYSPGELDRIFWLFGKDVCSAKPKCSKCPISKMCLTNLGIRAE